MAHQSIDSRDKLFTKYEGMAIMAAVRAWGRWADDLRTRGCGKDDLIQEAKLALLRIVSSLDARPEEARRAYIAKCLRGSMSGVIGQITANNPPTTSIITTESDESYEEIPELFDVDTVFLLSSLCKDDGTVVKLLMDGMSLTNICSWTGLSNYKLSRVLGRIRRAIERWRRE